MSNLNALVPLRIIAKYLSEDQFTTLLQQVNADREYRLTCLQSKVINFGKYKGHGLTYMQVHEKDPSYLPSLLGMDFMQSEGWRETREYIQDLLLR